MAFDGGARHRSPNACLPETSPRAAGAGAILWGPVNEEGSRECLAQILIAAPSASSSMVAEALGLRAALAVTLFAVGHPGEICVVGDNLPILRMASSNGRIKNPETWQLLDAPLSTISVQKWDCTWTAVRRCQNKTADALATLGTFRSIELAANGNSAPQVSLWVNGATARQDATALPWHTDWATTHCSHPFLSPEGSL